MNKVFAAFWYSGILPLLSCTTTIPTTTTTTTTTTTAFENHESLSRPQSAKKEGTKAKQNRKQNREKELEKKDKKKKKGFLWLKDQWRSVADKSSACYKNGGMRQSSSFSAKALAEKNRLLEEEQHLQAAVERATAEARQRAFQKVIAEEAAFEAELSRLNTAVDETAKVVQELKTEFSRRKSSRNLQVSSSKTEISTSPYKTRGKHTEEPQPEVLEMDRLEAELEFELQKLLWCSTEASGFEGKISDICEFNTDIHVQDSGVFVTEEGECASSVLTEEPQQEVLEMDRLEAELESELQKLPWCSTELLDFEEKYQTFVSLMQTMLLSKDFTNQMARLMILVN